jgi:hypothetical protein
LAPVSFEQRLIGVKMTPMAGNVEQPIVSIPEAAAFLQMASLERVIAAGPRASVPYIDPKALQAWTRDVFGDQELSEAIAEQASKAKNYREQAESARELLELRLEQARAVLAADEQDG